VTHNELFRKVNSANYSDACRMLKKLRLNNDGLSRALTEELEAKVRAFEKAIGGM
jgi:hypothetical protein